MKKSIYRNGFALLGLFAILTLGSCKKAAEKGTESDVTTVTDTTTTIKGDTTKFVDTTSTKKILKTNPEDGTNSGT